MARTTKATPTTNKDAAEADASTGNTITATVEPNGGGGDPTDSTQTLPNNTSENPDGGSNGSELTPAATAEGAEHIGTSAAVAPEPATVTLSEGHDEDDDDIDPADQVICRGRAVGGPRRRAGLAFDETPRPLTRADLGGTDEKIEETLTILAADRRLSLLRATD